MTHCTSQGKEPILQHEFISRPWAKVAADLCELDNRVLLVVSDFYRNYIEVARLNNLPCGNQRVESDICPVWCTRHPCHG